MSTVFKAMGELSVAAHRANVPEPRMVLEFSSESDLRHFQQQVLQDLPQDAGRPPRIKWMGVELVLSVRYVQ